MPNLGTCCHTGVSMFYRYENYPNLDVDNDVGKNNDNYRYGVREHNRHR
jgi:hypothetical protein